MNFDDCVAVCFKLFFEFFLADVFGLWLVIEQLELCLLVLLDVRVVPLVEPDEEQVVH